MAAELRVDTIKSRAGINTISSGSDGLHISPNVGIGTTVVSDVVTTATGSKIAVGIITCQNLFSAGTSHFKIPAGTTGQRPGTGVAGDIRFNSSLTKFEGYDGSVWGGLGGGTEEDTTVATTSASTVASLVHASHRSAFIRAQITQGSAYQTGRYIVIHDGTTVTVVEEAAVATGSMLGTFSGTISGANLLFQVTMGSATSATVTVIVDKITV
tara:strand:+ start:36 stop:674 length:639 start_codon:yes stop_codon:yes gene_type:complete